jgi:hypothetical protein
MKLWQAYCPRSYMSCAIGSHIIIIRLKNVSLLKVPKCQIFDRSDFHDFYTIKSLQEGDFGVKIKKFKKIFRGPFENAKFLKHMLSLILGAQPLQNILSIRISDLCVP